MFYVTAIDMWMSWWGDSHGKQNMYVIRCDTQQQANIASKNLRKRDDMKNVSVTTIEPRPSKTLCLTFASEHHSYFLE